MIETIGWIGTWCLALCGIPAAWKSYKEGHSKGLSSAFLGLWLAGEVLTLIYVIPKMDWPLIFNFVANIGLISVMVYYKIWPRTMFHKLTPMQTRQLDRAAANRPTIAEYLRDFPNIPNRDNE